MAQNKVTIHFEGKGSPSLRRELELLAKAQDKVNGKNTEYSNVTKKVINNNKKLNDSTVASVRNNRILGGSLATVRSKLLLFNFAMAMGIRQLIDFTHQAAKISAMRTGFNTLSGSVENSSIALQRLKKATDGTMSEFDLFQQANNAMILGVSKNSKEMAEMFDVAQRLGRALGRDTKSSVESLITGIGRQSRLMLDNIGIIVKADDAYKEYAKELRKNVDDLTDSEKKQAFLNATMDAARLKVASLGTEQLSAIDSINKFNASMKDLAADIGEVLVPVIVGAANAISDIKNFLDSLGETGIEKTIRQLEEFGGAAEDIQKLQEIQLSLDIRDLNRELEDMGANFSSSKEVLDVIKDLEKENLHLITAQVSQHAKRTSGLNKLSSLKKDHIDQEKKLQKMHMQRDLFSEEEIKKQIEKSNNASRLFYQEQKIVNAKRESADNEIDISQERIDMNNDEIDALNTILSIILDIEAAKARIANQPTGTNDEEVSLYEELSKAADKSMKSIVANSVETGKAYKNTGLAAQDAAASVVIAEAQKMTSILITKIFSSVPYPFNLILGAGAGAAAGSLLQGAIGQAKKMKFEQGGLVGGRRHSQGGTMIEAERGEFVMSRNAVNAVGLEAMNRINQGQGVGGVNISFNGNVMSQDFIEDEAIPMIKEAIRRGADIGVS